VNPIAIFHTALGHFRPINDVCAMSALPDRDQIAALRQVT
jgi:hypothetical protein